MEFWKMWILLTKAKIKQFTIKKQWQKTISSPFMGVL